MRQTRTRSSTLRTCSRIPNPFLGAAGALVFLIILVGCQTAPPLPPADLKEGWTIRQGQAVWQRPHGTTEIAGEILLATRGEGRSFVQFSKSGFPLIIAQSTPQTWQVELPSQNKRYSGHGLPPRRLLILYLPRALAGDALPPGWSWRKPDQDRWRLSNDRSGESLEGYFNP